MGQQETLASFDYLASARHESSANCTANHFRGLEINTNSKRVGCSTGISAGTRRQRSRTPDRAQ
jgi:hypothetical protein